mgnify:CR=1 FL=1
MTVVELLIVVAIIGTLASIIIPTLTEQTEAEKNNQAASDIAVMGASIAVFINDFGVPPDNLGLVGSEIDIKARVLAVADVYDAMTNPRPCRDSVDSSDVVNMIREQSGSQFDPDVVEALMTVIDSAGGSENKVMLRRDVSLFYPAGRGKQGGTGRS